jgi:hypothetical protein
MSPLTTVHDDEPTAAQVSPVVRMYATKRRFPGQLATARTENVGLTWSESLPLYAWADFVATTMPTTETSKSSSSSSHPLPQQQQYLVYMVADNSNGLTTLESSPSYCASHHSGGGGGAVGTTTTVFPTLTIVGRTLREWRPTPCAMLSLCQGDLDGSDIFLKLSLSQGMDPALLVCLACFVDECLEKLLRTQSS